MLVSSIGLKQKWVQSTSTSELREHEMWLEHQNLDVLCDFLFLALLSGAFHFPSLVRTLAIIQFYLPFYGLLVV